MRRLLLLATMLGALFAFSGVAHATSVANTALINGDSVTTDDGIMKGSTPISLEQYAAERAGFTVTVVTGAQWDSMTAAQFAHYQLLIHGDPDCGSTADSFTSDSSTWAPVVMGKSVNTTQGNRALVGTDPEDHYQFGDGGAKPTDPSNPSTAGAEHLVQAGIAFAGNVRGATGVYFDTSCEDNGSIVSTLDKLTTTGAGHWTEDSSPPCGGSVQKIATVPQFSIVKDSDIQGWECSDHITFPAFPTDWNAVAVATDTSSHPTCGTDPDTKTTACGESYVLVSGNGVVATSPDISLSPTSATNPVGTDHTVTATVAQKGRPVSGAVVSFAVSGTNAGVSGTCTRTGGVSDPNCSTGSDGKVSFTYHDVNGAGNDTINASVTLGGSVEHATATKTWQVPPATTAPAPPPPPPPTNECVDVRRFTFRLHHAPHTRITKVEVFVDGVHTLTKHGHNLKTLTIDKLPQRYSTVKIIVFQSNGSTRTSKRIYLKCTKGKPKVRSHHHRRHHHHHHHHRG